MTLNHIVRLFRGPEPYTYSGRATVDFDQVATLDLVADVAGGDAELLAGRFEIAPGAYLVELRLVPERGLTPSPLGVVAAPP